MEHMWGLTLDGPAYDSITGVLDLARFPNVYLKLAPNNSQAAREQGNAPREFFGRLVERFGPKRLMWRSNYPAHSDRFGDLADRLQIMQEDFAFLDADDRDWVFAQTAPTLWPGFAG